MVKTISGWRTAFLLVLAASIGTLAFLAGGAGAAGTYTDKTGDNGAAPDIVDATVASDLNGQIVFTIDLAPPGLASVTPDVGIGLFIDSDANPATGNLDGGGIEYGFVLTPAERVYSFEHWNGADWEEAPYSTVSVFNTATSITISVNRTELGGTGEFNFFAVSIVGDGSAGRDFAPDVGAFNYSLTAQGPDILGLLIVTSPSFGPKAGQPFSISQVNVKLPSTGGIGVMPAPDGFSCTATLAGKALAGTGAGGCTFKVPATIPATSCPKPKKNAKPKAKPKPCVVTTVGKKLTVSVTATYQGATKTVPFAFTVQ